MVVINPLLDFCNLQTQFAQDQRICIENFWQHESAQNITHHLAERVQFNYAFSTDGVYHEKTQQELMSLSPDQRSMMQKKLMQLASEGVGFWYGRKMIRPQPEDNDLLQQVHRLLNSEQVLQHIRDISGYDDIICASAQATRYLPGSYLTRHRDVVAAEGRRLAYVMSFTESWHPDWGGLLQFYEDNGTPRDAWAPRFNSMVLFDVRHVHAVTYVAPYALKPRLSITGWFRTVPLI
uniref:Fe2OG dioxygenase domain-containing protein n=1 Tax=Rheinheimera sp. BAL341 TaxID=1708203 RepID=A0A486XT19_9GAMM